MLKRILDALIGMAVALVLFLTWAGIVGYYDGFLLDGPDKTYGGDGAATAIVFAVIFFGPYVAGFGLLAGLVLGWGVRWWKARRR